MLITKKLKTKKGEKNGKQKQRAKIKTIRTTTKKHRIQIQRHQTPRNLYQVNTYTKTIQN